MCLRRRVHAAAKPELLDLAVESHPGGISGYNADTPGGSFSEIMTAPVRSHLQPLLAIDVGQDIIGPRASSLERLRSAPC